MGPSGAMAAPLGTLLLFGAAGATGSDGPSPSGLVFKLTGRGSSKDDYTIVLVASNGATASYIARFSLASLIDAVEDQGLLPSGEMVLDWLRTHFRGGEPEARLGGGGAMQLGATFQSSPGYSVTLKLPPTQPVEPQRDPARAAWVTQELLFSQALWARRMAHIQAHGGAKAETAVDKEEQLQQLNQQLDDLLAFLDGQGQGDGAAPQADLSVAGGAGAVAAAAGDSAAPAVPPPPRVAHIPAKRKQQEAEAAAPASGSAVKAPRPAAAQPPAARAQPGPASTQQTGASGASQSTQRTAGQPLVVAGRGRGRGRGIRRPPVTSYRRNMDTLEASSAACIASFLSSERDLAALRCASRAWRDVLSDNPGLWTALLRRRFGEAAGEGGDAAARGGAEAPELRFRELAMGARRRSVAGLERVVWLDGHHLQRYTDPTSHSGTAIRVLDVWWLELGGRFRGVLPGRYRAAWRLRLEPHYALQSVRLIARPLLPGTAEEAVDGGEAQQQLGTAVDTLIGRSSVDALALEVGGGWFEMASAPFEVRQLCDVWVKMDGTASSWKRGICFDSVRLMREQPAPEAAAAAAAAAAEGRQARQHAGGGHWLLRWMRGGLARRP